MCVKSRPTLLRLRNQIMQVWTSLKKWPVGLCAEWVVDGKKPFQDLRPSKWNVSRESEIDDDKIERNGNLNKTEIDSVGRDHHQHHRYHRTALNETQLDWAGEMENIEWSSFIEIYGL